MLSTVVAVIPYTTHPDIEVGPLTLRSFGAMVALGVILGIWFGAVHGEKYGVHRDDAYSIGTRMVIAGVVGARLTWVLTHLDQIDSPIDVIAVWEGGLQFAGGFIAAIAVGMPTFLKWNRLQRWQLLDGYAVAVAIGAAFGRLGCLAVGEHFGRQSDFFLATRYDGGALRETTLGLDANAPVIVKGMSFLNPALYECVTLFLMAGGLYLLLRRRPTPGTVGGVYLIVYAVQRFVWDSMRVNDERVLGLTGAQWMCVAMIPIGIYVLGWVRPAMARAIEAGEVGGTPVWETTTASSADGRAVATRKRRPGAGRPAHARTTAEDERSDADADADASTEVGASASTEVDAGVDSRDGDGGEGPEVEDAPGDDQRPGDEAEAAADHPGRE